MVEPLENPTSYVIHISLVLQLAIPNILTSYLFDQFRVSIETAGGLAALLGLINIIR